MAPIKEQTYDKENKETNLVKMGLILSCEVLNNISIIILYSKIIVIGKPKSVKYLFIHCF